MSTRRVIDATGRPESHPTVMAPLMLAVTSRLAVALYGVVVGHQRGTYAPTACVGLMTDDDAGRML